MDSAFPIILILEFMIPPMLLAGILTFFFLKRGKTNQDIAESIAEDSAAKLAEQKQALQKWLKSELGYSDQELEASVNNIMNWRNALFKNFIHGCMKQDPDLLKGFSHDFAVFFQQCIELKNKIEPVVEEDTEAKDQVIQLTEAKQQLEKELSDIQQQFKHVEKEKDITLNTLNNIFAEYMTMFGDDIQAGDMTVDQIIAAMDKIISEDDIDDEGFDQASAIENSTNVDEELISEEPELEDDEDDDEDGDPDLISEEPSWDEAFAEEDDGDDGDPDLIAEEPVVDEAEAESTAPEDDVSWEDTFAEEGDGASQAPTEPAPAAASAGQDEDDVSWEDAFAEEGGASEEQAEQDSTDKKLTEEDVSWEEAFSEEAGEEGEEEPNWEDAFAEEGDADSEEQEPSWEDAFAEGDGAEAKESESGEEPSWEDAFSEIDGEEGEAPKDEESSWEDAFTDLDDDKKS